jgi:hypothetical protein
VDDNAGVGLLVWVGDGLAECDGLGDADGVTLAEDVLAGWVAAGVTEAVVSGVIGRTHTHRASTPRNATISTRVEVRGRCTVTGHFRAPGQSPGQPGR